MEPPSLVVDRNISSERRQGAVFDLSTEGEGGNNKDKTYIDSV